MRVESVRAKARSDEGGCARGRTLYVGNLGFDVTKDELVDADRDSGCVRPGFQGRRHVGSSVPGSLVLFRGSC